jgi:hypothetical protein
MSCKACSTDALCSSKALVVAGSQRPANLLALLLNQLFGETNLHASAGDAAGDASGCAIEAVPTAAVCPAVPALALVY